jgi:transcriptional regulator with XRE-family HTH domain
MKNDIRKIEKYVKYVEILIYAKENQDISQREIASKFGASLATVHRLIHGKDSSHEDLRLFVHENYRQLKQLNKDQLLEYVAIKHIIPSRSYETILANKYLKNLYSQLQMQEKNLMKKRRIRKIKCCQQKSNHIDSIDVIRPRNYKKYAAQLVFKTKSQKHPKIKIIASTRDSSKIQHLAHEYDCAVYNVSNDNSDQLKLTGEENR